MTTVELPLGIRLLQRIEFPRKLGIMERFYAATLARKGICWVDTAAGRPWKLDLAGSTHRWIVYGKYEGADFHRWAEKFLPRDGVIVDSGANIGQMLLYLVDFIPQGKVFAFEPGEGQRQWLEECLAQNPELPVEVLPFGLGAEVATVLLHDDSPPMIHGGQSRISEIEGVPIQIVRLDEELAKRGVDRVDLWKLDVEGYEVPALEGASTLLERQAIGAIYVELISGNGPRIKDYLEGFGYRCHYITTSGEAIASDPLPKQDNGLFLPTVKR